MELRTHYNSQILKFLLKVLFLFCLVVIADQLAGRILRKLYFSQNAGAAFRTTYTMDSTTAEILIFGSSRANHHYVPNVFEEGLKMSYYNTGRDGNFILYNYAVLKCVLFRYIPKIIILDINPEEFYYDPLSYERLSSLLPYYSNHPEIRSIVKLKSPYEKIKLLSATYPFNSSLLTIGIGNLNINKKRKPDNKGYIPLNGKMKETGLEPVQNPSVLIDVNKIQALDSITGLCYRKGIELFICYSPVYARTRETKIDSLIRIIANEHKFKYLNFSNDPDFISRTDLFRDMNHLNSEGAVIYSSLLVDSILFYYRSQTSKTFILNSKRERDAACGTIAKDNITSLLTCNLCLLSFSSPTH